MTLKLERLSTIRSVDIGNDGCAFVEVLVARDDDVYEVCLLCRDIIIINISSNDEKKV